MANEPTNPDYLFELDRFQVEYYRATPDGGGFRINVWDRK